MFDEAVERDEDTDGRIGSSEHDSVGTVEVQILLSWFFEGSGAEDLAIDLPHAA